MTTIAVSTVLCLGEPDGLSDVFLREPWVQQWTEIWRGDPVSLGARIGSFVRLTSGQSVPELHGREAHVWLRDLEQLTAARATPGWVTIVFEPSGLSTVDAVRLGRSSLVAGRVLGIGHLLTEDDIDIVPGGTGIPASLKSSVVGKKLCYPLARNQEITFGYIE